ncbi:MAG: phosphatidylserine decarboxylase [Candidatus Sumerlaeaceae bacterium]|nr:phosphatidylserine decarboxylase [Candidatus Sumerlaeaceae bacterium]
MKYSTTHPIAREAAPFLAPTLTLALVLIAYGVFSASAIASALGGLSLLSASYVAWFFRHPRRELRRSASHLIAPADGTVTSVGVVPHSSFPNGQAVKVAVFMSLFDVHINWSPCDAAVEKTEYFPGKFLNAMDDKASEQNERKIIYLRCPNNDLVIVKLVAGLVARRIVSPLEATDEVAQGEAIGLIRFGSRVEVLAPTHYQPLVKKGDKVLGRVSALMVSVNS